MVKGSEFFRSFWPALWGRLGRSWRFCTGVCAGLCPACRAAFGVAGRGGDGGCPLRGWGRPQVFEFLTPPPPAPRGPMDPAGGGGASADIVRTQVMFGVGPCARCWGVAREPPGCRGSPLAPMVAGISFAPFSARRGPPAPRGERARPEPGCACVRALAWVGPRVVGGRWRAGGQTNKHTVSQVPRPSLCWRVAGNNEGFGSGIR